MQEPIIIAGFGRSGTTWISDIISKILGGIILFEPDHPCVLKHSQDFMYQQNFTRHDSDFLITRIERVLNKEKNHDWLLRNHLPQNVKISEDFIKNIWVKSKIIGFKAIRWNHSLNFFIENISRKVVFIIRHPIAVVASLRNRPRFFEEFGWEEHWRLFKQRNPLPQIDLAQYNKSEVSIKYVVMWTISNIKALSDLKISNLPHFQYEQLYAKPYEESLKIMEFLGYNDKTIHPSYVFYPSMSTLKTFHIRNPEESWKEVETSRMFWQQSIDNTEAQKLSKTILGITENFPDAHEAFHNMKYLDL